MNNRLLKIPNSKPIASEESDSSMKFPIIVKGVVAVKFVSLSYCTVLNKMILTISLNTPSPYTIENSLG